MKPKLSKIGIFLVVVAFVLIGFSMSTILREPRVLQYTAPADTTLLDTQDEEGEWTTMLASRRDALLDTAEYTDILSQNMEAYTLSAEAPKISVAAYDAKTKTTGTGTLAGLVAAGENYFRVYPSIPRMGRILNPEELERGLDVAVIDEQLAIALFQQVEVIDREIVISGRNYRIVGVLRHEKQVGDDADYYCYIPYNAVAKQSGLQFQTLLLSARPLERGGAMASFKEITGQWIAGGNAYDLGREKTGAWIWARYLMVGLGFALWGILAGVFVHWVQALFTGLKSRLSRQYMGRVLPWLLLNILLRLAGLVALGAAAAGLMLFLLEQPINAFPEYVPAILVEPREIATTFWGLRATDAQRVTYQTAQVARLTYFASVIKSSVILMLAGFSMIFFRLRAGRR